MDEPFAALDALTRRKMQEELLPLWDDVRFTVLFVTHSIEEALLVGSRILVLSPHPGRVKAELNADHLSFGDSARRPSRRCSAASTICCLPTDRDRARQEVAQWLIQPRIARAAGAAAAAGARRSARHDGRGRRRRAPAVVLRAPAADTGVRRLILVAVLCVAWQALRALHRTIRCCFRL